jgi:hypothetical protein
VATVLGKTSSGRRADTPALELPETIDVVTVVPNNKVVHDDEEFQTKLHPDELAHILKQYGAEILKTKEEECEEIHYSKKQLCMYDLKSR